LAKVLHPFQNISKNELKKLDVFGQKFVLTTSFFVDQLLFIFWDRGSIIYNAQKSTKPNSTRYSQTTLI
jgi:hypothetical protein